MLQIAKGGPAAKAGLREGDVILKIGDTEVNSVADLRGAVDEQAVGNTVSVTILRKGNQQTVNVLLEEMPTQQ